MNNTQETQDDQKNTQAQRNSSGVGCSPDGCKKCTYDETNFNEGDITAAPIVSYPRREEKKEC